MGQALGTLALAFSMYSILPMPKAGWEKANMRYVMCCFPLVGVVIGAAVYGWLWLCARAGFGAGLTAAVAVVIPAAISGGIHLDGFCDTLDALASHQNTERKLEILSDSHVGAFALIGFGIYMILSLGLWSEYRFTAATAAVIAVCYVLSRALSGIAIVRFHCAKKSGLAALFADAAAKRAAFTALLLTACVCAAALLLISPWVGGCCLLAAAAVFLYYRHMAYKSFGGITGDLAGYFLQLCEIAMLAAAVLAGRFLA